jgi:decaprenyl-phosphate phosphoribosyltransferase
MVLRGLVRAVRPRQWLKNVLVAVPAAAAGTLLDHGVVLQVLQAFVALTLVAAGTYLVNDVADAAEDRAHPLKRHRPVASGQVPAKVAIATGAGLVVAGCAVAATQSLALLGVVALYVAVSLVYSVWLRRVVVLDLAAIASLFVVRLLAGGAATDIRVSRALLAVTTLGAVFVVAGKRESERRHTREGAPTRPTLRRYSPTALRLTWIAAAIGAIGVYVAWAVLATEPAGASAWYEASIVPFLGFMARYASIAARGAAGAPEDVLLGDRVLLLLAAAWLLAFAGGAYVGA